MAGDLHASRTYKEAMLLGDLVAAEVRSWRFHDRDVIGRQFERAAHSVAANVAEAYGRSSAADKRRFITYAIASSHEASSWLEKAARLRLVRADTHRRISGLLDSLRRRLSAYRGTLTRRIG